MATWYLLVNEPATVRDTTVTASLRGTSEQNIRRGSLCGIGRGDSPAVMGKKTQPTANLAQAVQVIRDLNSGKRNQYDGQPITG